MEVSDYGGVRSNPTPPPMKGELLMYVEKTDTYTCDFCGHNAKWDASDDVHGELWSCESRFGMGRRRKPSSTMTGTEPLHTTARSIRISKKENKK